MAIDIKPRHMCVQDGVKVEFEDDLPFHLFAVRMPFAWVSGERRDPVEEPRRTHSKEKEGTH